MKPELSSPAGIQTCVHFSAEAKFGYGGKQYVARLTGRDRKFTFAREFLGQKTGKRREYCSEDVDEPGVYMTCDIDRKGNKDETYYAVVEYRGNVRRAQLTKAEAMLICKGLDAGKRFEELVAVSETGEVYEKTGLPVIRIDAK